MLPWFPVCFTSNATLRCFIMICSCCGPGLPVSPTKYFQYVLVSARYRMYRYISLVRQSCKLNSNINLYMLYYQKCEERGEKSIAIQRSMMRVAGPLGGAVDRMKCSRPDCASRYLKVPRFTPTQLARTAANMTHHTYLSLFLCRIHRVRDGVLLECCGHETSRGLQSRAQPVQKRHSLL